MTAKQKVRQAHPRANCAAYRTPQKQITHHIVWSHSLRSGIRLGCGRTQAEAWKAASQTLQPLSQQP